MIIQIGKANLLVDDLPGPVRAQEERDTYLVT